MTDAITRCPKCATSFRITKAHLESAKGAVRCGSCLSVFNAADHLLAPKPPAEPQEPTPKPPGTEASKEHNTNNNEKEFATSTAVELAASSVDDADDDILISDDMDERISDQDELGDNIYLPETGHLPESNLFEREAISEKEENTHTDDDSWALSLLEEKEAAQTAIDLKNAEHQEEMHDDVATFDEMYRHDEIDLSQSALSITDDQEDEYIEPEFERSAPEKTLSSVNSTNATTEAETEPAFSFYDEEEDAEPQEPKHNYIESIQPEPVEFAFKKSLPFWRSRGLYSALSVAFMLLLVIQIAWLRFDDLSTVKPYRSFYAYGCKIIGCKLPQLVDINKIRINQLIVRSHPTTNNALIVDAIILNNANFEQPFPKLTLVFTDMQNNIMAHRIFEPLEYLGGELKGRTEIPPLQPVSLNFQIVDPGENAVNYLLTISQ